MFLCRTPRSTARVLAEVAIFLAAPPALGLVGALPASYRWWPASLTLILVLVRFLNDGWSLERLGLRPEKVWDGWRPQALLTVASCLGLIAVWWILDPQLTTKPLTVAMVGFSFFVSFVQEALFRTFLIEKLEARGWPKFYVLLISAFTFAMIHVFFEAYFFAFIFQTFLYGWLMGEIYWRYRNLYMATLGHFAVNLLAVFLCYTS